MTQEVIQITNPDLTQAVHYIDLQDKVLGYDGQVPENEREDAINKQTEEVLSRVVAITQLIPETASITNPLATANDSASFKGNFDTWSNVPASNWDTSTLGPAPSKNDYIIVVNAADYDDQDPKYNACWRFKYTAPNTITYTNANFVPEYNINSQYTPTQEEVFNSGISATRVGNYDAHLANDALHVYNTTRTAAVDSGINATLVGQITTNQNNIATNANNISLNAADIVTINSKIPSTATSSQKLRTSKNIIVKTGSETFISDFTTDADIIVTGAGTITIQGQGSENGREISIIPTVDNVFLKINGDATEGRQLTANTALTFTWSSSNNKWNMLGGQATYTNTVTLTGQYTDGTSFTFVIPAVTVS